MSSETDENYVANFQNYLKQKDSNDQTLKLASNQTTQLRPPKKNEQKNSNCKICAVLSKPGDLGKILNQGLYHKYTASQDYFYTKDINALLQKSRKPYCIRFKDDKIYDTEKEYLRRYYEYDDAVCLMAEIQNFYTKFRDFPRNFDESFYKIIQWNIRKHRKLEYIKVFKSPETEETEQDQPKSKCDFNFMEMLGESFLRENYKDISNIKPAESNKQRKPTEESLTDIERNFQILKKVSAGQERFSPSLSNAFNYQNNLLLSRNDSDAGEEVLRELAYGISPKEIRPKKTVPHKIANLSKKPSPTISRNVSPGKNNFQGSVRPTSAKPENKFFKAAASNIKLATGQTIDSREAIDKRSIEPKKRKPKVGLSNVQDVPINKNTLMQKIEQFRSTRASSAKKSNILAKTPSNSGTRRSANRRDSNPLFILSTLHQTINSELPRSPGHVISPSRVALQDIIESPLKIEPARADENNKKEKKKKKKKRSTSLKNSGIAKSSSQPLFEDVQDVVRYVSPKSHSNISLAKKYYLAPARLSVERSKGYSGIAHSSLTHSKSMKNLHSSLSFHNNTTAHLLREPKESNTRASSEEKHGPTKALNPTSQILKHLLKDKVRSKVPIEESRRSVSSSKLKKSTSSTRVGTSLVSSKNLEYSDLSRLVGPMTTTNAGSQSIIFKTVTSQGMYPFANKIATRNPKQQSVVSKGTQTLERKSRGLRIDEKKFEFKDDIHLKSLGESLLAKSPYRSSSNLKSRINIGPMSCKASDRTNISLGLKRYKD